MRQRKARGFDERMEACSRYLTECPEVDGRHIYFDDDKDLYVEIGCGKGNFIIKKALENPDKNFVAVEGQDTVILRALEKVDEASEGQGIPNLKFMVAFIQDISEFFDEGQLAGIYLNFSDPWPKARHAKRRLTYRKRLDDYAWALRKGGFVEFKTDNDGLYDFSLEEIEAAGYEIVEQTRDLHASEYESKYTTTEYEDKFSSQGKNINYVKIVV